MVEKRRNFTIARRFVDPGSFVFLDESGAKTNMTRLYGRAPVGERCTDHTPHGHWKSCTMLSAMRLDGVIEDATVLVDGAVDADAFLRYTEHCLAPSLRPGDVVVMDNLAAHKVPSVLEAIHHADAELWFLPAYSPDLNPIEKLWSKVKAWLRRAAPDTFDAIGQAVADALRAVDPIECANYFGACGYHV